MRPPAGTTRLTRSQRAQASAIAAAGYPTVALLGRTLRWTVRGYEHYGALEQAGQPPIFAFWHGRILAATYFWRRRGIVVMTSANFDGEWIARIIERFGYGTARGSTSRDGRRALAQLRRDMQAGRPAAFTVDGPRGPARSVQPGAVWLARLTGQPILPFHIEAVPVLDRTELGSRPGSEAVRPRRDRRGATHSGAAGERGADGGNAAGVSSRP